VTLAGLREALDTDWWPVIALIGACWAEYPGCVMDVAREYPELLAPASHFARTGGTFWVLPEGHWVAACIGLGPIAAGSVELVKLYVARHRRGEGLGGALVGFVEGQARARGAREIELFSDSRFHPAHRLYERHGFMRTGASRQLHDLSATTEYQFRKTLRDD
jgi:putative acetyltransferase